jgi:hypothetical protein
MAAALLEPGTRLLHIGPHKTGTTAIQGALHLARERLAGEGVIYPGRGRQSLWPILAVTGQPALLGGPRPEISYWDNLVREVRAAGDQRVVLSSEFFAEADDATARRVIADLGGARVHVVVTLRSLTRILPSQWQQYLQNGFHFRYPEWLEGILSDPPRTPTPGFWRRHRHDALVARWAAENGPENLTVIVLDESDRLMLLRVFESMLGLPGGFLVPEERAANRSLTVAEAELVRLLNEEFTHRAWPHRDYARFMRYGAVEQMKNARQPSPDEPRIATPAWALARAGQISAEMAARIETLGVNIVGDISSLGKLPGDGPGLVTDDGSAPPLVPVEAAACATLGAFIAGGAGGQTVEEIVRDVDGRSLARALARRCRQRVRRNLPGWPAPGR